MFNSKNGKPENDGMTLTAPTPSKVSSNGSAGPILNIIGAGTTVEGIISCDGDIRIEGHVKGTVKSKAKIVVGNTGSVEGDLFCDNADISGKIFGSVEVTEMLFLKSTAYLEGDITTTKFVVEAGAKFNGNCRMGVKEIKPNEKPAVNGTQQLKKEAV
jgi:cytoskeletal protein CcmA (bactofilin family)